MQASSRHAGKCVFCDFRSHLVQVRRQQLSLTRPFSTTVKHGREDSTHGSPFRRLPGFGPPRGQDERSERGRGDRSRRGRDDRSGRGRDDRPKEGKDRQTSDNKDRKFTIPKFGPKPKFSDALQHRLKAIKDELKDAPILKHLGRDDTSFSRVWRTFVASLTATGPPTFTKGVMSPNKQEKMQDLKEAYHERGVNSLDDRLKYAFYHHITGSRFTESDIRNQKTLADLRYPTEWFPATRTMHRTIHLHVGPTNSGKTYHALKRLEQADSGVYAGPLRLLAHEVFTRLNAKGKRCTLITGEEKRSPDDSLTSDMQSCTVEMMPLNKTVDVAVIDEIQMIGNAERGWAWTQALLGVKAHEVHLCGEIRTVPLIREICASIGEKLVVHEYERLSPLQMADKSLDGDLTLLQKGDCIVSFSVIGIHALRRQIEKITGKKAAIVYGSLPPETRAQQARLFNDPDNDYDFLVASDAIGMGLNLSIKRIIFETATKYDGYRQRTLAIADIKQIGGRAGRYRSAHEDNESAKTAQDVETAKGEDPPVEVEASQSTNIAPSEALASEIQAAKATRPVSSTVGLVTTLEKFDFPVISGAMGSEPEPIRTAGIFPPAPIVERFATYFPPGTPFSYILMRLHELSQMHSRFHLCGLRDQLWIADLIEPIQGLTTTDRNILCACPAGKTEDLFKQLMPAFARCIEQQRGGSLLDMPEMPLEILELEPSTDRAYLRQLERLHKGLVAYLWLSYRFAGIFTTRPLAFHVKGLVEEKIEGVLSQFSFTEAQRKKLTAAREQSIIDSIKRDSEGSKPQGEESGESDVSTQDIESSQAQTSYNAGGDRFGGEEDIAVLDPIESMEEDDAPVATDTIDTGADLPPKSHSSTFAQSRSSSDQLREGDELSFDPVSKTDQPQVREGELLGPEEKAFDPAVSSDEDAALSNAAAGVTPETEGEEKSSPLHTQVEPPSLDGQQDSTDNRSSRS